MAPRSLLLSHGTYLCLAQFAALPVILLHVEIAFSTLFDYWSACMATAASPRQMMYAQIMSQPALLLEVFDTTERMVQDAFSHLQPQRWQAIYTAGCGDSFYAGLACEMAF